MFPPLPPAMPPWPGNRPPWERTAEVTQSPPPRGQQQGAQGAPGLQQAGAGPTGPLFPVRPQVVHGLVPPQMLPPTVPFWITPQYFRARPPVQQPPQGQQQPAAQRQPQQSPDSNQGAIHQTPAGPVRVERTEEKSSKPQPFLPVMPVVSPGLPVGARQREYWTRN